MKDGDTRFNPELGCNEVYDEYLGKWIYVRLTKEDLDFLDSLDAE